MLRKTKFITSLNLDADTKEEFVFEQFKTFNEYNSTKEYFLLYSDEYYCWDIYEILPK